MTSVINEQNNEMSDNIQNLNLPPPPKNVLQIIHPDLLEKNSDLLEKNSDLIEKNTNFTPLKKFRRLIPGEFKYVPDKNERIMLINAWQAITQTKTWDFVREPIESFSFSNHPKLNIISNKMVQLGYDGHSGCSFGGTMRCMQYIAKYGEKDFKDKYYFN